MDLSLIRGVLAVPRIGHGLDQLGCALKLVAVALGGTATKELGLTALDCRVPGMQASDRHLHCSHGLAIDDLVKAFDLLDRQIGASPLDHLVVLSLATKGLLDGRHFLDAQRRVLSCLVLQPRQVRINHVSVEPSLSQLVVVPGLQGA